MYSVKHSVLACAGLVVLLSSIALLTPRTGFGQKAAPSPMPSPQPVNVLVTNTPLPVTGTITGSVSVANTLEVNVANTPTVKLDPAGNTVHVAPAGTKLVYDSGYVERPGGLTTIGPIDISQYSKIRIAVNNNGPTDIEVVVQSTLSTTPPIKNFLIDSFNVEDNVGSAARGGPSVTKLYEVVGTKLLVLLVLPQDETHQVEVAVFGS